MISNNGIMDAGYSAVASQPRPFGHITADKREIKDSPKIALLRLDSVQVGNFFYPQDVSRNSGAKYMEID
jgi:hypothetical protein